MASSQSQGFRFWFASLADQVLRDSQTTSGKEFSELSEGDQDKMRRYMFLQAKQVFDAELQESERQETDQLGKARRPLDG